VQIVKRNYCINEKVRKKEEEREEKRIGNKSISVKKHKVTSSSTRGLVV
jgi:hypothetical protein